jgi:Na+/phosphate symporter
MLGKIGDQDLRAEIIRVYGSAKSLFDYLNCYSRQSDTGKDAEIEKLKPKLRAQIEEIQNMVSDVQKRILAYSDSGEPKVFRSAVPRSAVPYDNTPRRLST